MGELKNRIGQLTQEQRARLAEKLGVKAASDRLIAYVVAGEDADSDLLKEHLRSRVPKHFVPSVIVPVETLPKLPNGKIDRSSLPKPVAFSSSSVEDTGTGSPAEEILREIWQDVLGMEVVALDDDFFEIGGDSILSIQLVSRARAQGIDLAPGALADYPTVRALAGAARQVEEAKSAPEVEEGSPIPLTPIQHWFFGLDLAKPEQWNQAFAYELGSDISDAEISQVIEALLERHEQFRVGFHYEEDSWVQCAGSTADLIFENTDLEILQTSFAFDGRPLVRFSIDRGGRLVIVAHHLVIDHVSWQVLGADIDAALGFLAEGKPVEFCEPVTSFGRAARELAVREVSDDALALWRASDLADLGRIPVDYEVTKPLEADAATVRISVDASGMDEALSAYSASAREFALAALVRKMSVVTGRETLRIGLEGHGRDLEGTRLDVGQSVGWFTSFFPARIRVAVDEDAGTTIKSVKETARCLESAAADYGYFRYNGSVAAREAVSADEAAEDILFNHLGNITTSSQGNFIQSVEMLSAYSRAPENRRSHLLEINSWFEGEQLIMDWVFNKAVHDRATIEAWSAAYADEFQALITHCTAAAPGFTPSDFPEAELKQEELDDFLDSL